MPSSLPLFLLLSVAAHVSGRSTYPKLLPNGLAGTVAGSGINCSHLGHINCNPPKNNNFGLDFKAAGYKWTKEFCEKDSDNDGLTNGEELGDPCCEWSTATNSTPARTTNLSHPGNASLKAMGDVSCPAARKAAANASLPMKSPSALAASPNATAAANATVSATPAAGSTDVCFPADATVALRDGRVVDMANLEVGDEVRVGQGVYSPVFMFTHRMDDVISEFVRVRTSAGAVLRLSRGHFLYVDGRLVPAAQVRVGQVVEVDGEPDVVVALDRVVEKGLFNPQTVHGDIVVDRVRCSTFTQAMDYRGAQAALAPLRAIYGWFGVSLRIFERDFHDGSHCLCA